MKIPQGLLFLKKNISGILRHARFEKSYDFRYILHIWVHIWYIFGTWWVRGGYVDGTWIVRGWYVDGTWMVCGWYVVGTWLVRGWYVDSTPNWTTKGPMRIILTMGTWTLSQDYTSRAQCGLAASLFAAELHVA